jgi:uncharacterized protein
MRNFLIPLKYAILMPILCVVSLLLLSCSKTNMPINNYYDYDATLPLEENVQVEDEKSEHTTWHVSFLSVNQATVTGLLTVPSEAPQPVPAVIFLHGVGDNKNVDYIQSGTQYLLDAGYAVLRIDIANHGERKIQDYDFDLTDGLKFWTRSLLTQTVFDLQRSVDFLQTRPEIDAERIGFFGISLGGIIGTVFCGVEERVKVPVIALAGGGLNVMFKSKALAEETRIFLSVIDPINFVEKISPRPLLMINAAQDEIVPPLTTKLLYNKAGKPKNIIWYESTHRRVPLEKAYPETVGWFDEYLK